MTAQPRRRRQAPRQEQQEESAPASSDVLRVQIRWEGTEQVPINYVNQVFARVSEDGQIILSFGSVESPHENPISEESLNRIKQEGLLIHPVARFAVTTRGLRNMIVHLNQVLKLWQDQEQRIAAQQEQQEEGGQQ